MMIKIRIFFLIILIVNIGSRINFAGDEKSISPNSNKEVIKQEDNVIDIKELVQKQIETAQQKKNNQTEDKMIKYEDTREKYKSLSKSSVKETGVVNDYDLGILFAVGIGITILLLLVTRLIRKKEVEIDDDLQYLKRKIEMLRNEEPFITDDRKTSELRKELCEKTIGSKKRVFKKNSGVKDFNLNQTWNSLNILDDKFSGTARKLNISKGELILASRIKALEYEKNYRLM